MQIGKHLCEYEPPDIVFWRFAGDISEDEIRRIYADLVSYQQPREYFLILVDLTAVGNVSAGVRKASVETRESKAQGTALFGASTHLRVLANFVIRAANLVTKRTRNPVCFFPTEAEARAWLAERRQMILSTRQ